MSITNSLLVGKSALLAHQQRIATISHNIANANTKGYHKQTAKLNANPPQMPGQSNPAIYSVGSGVSVSDIQRAYNRLHEMMFLGELSTSSYCSTKAETLRSIEALVSGTSENSLSVRLQSFWNAWQDVANNPDNIAMRTALLGKSGSLADYINTLTNNLSDFREQISYGDGTPGNPFGGTIKTEIDDLNTIASQIQDINAIMTRMPTSTLNDLLDRRDMLIRDLSEKANIDVDLDFNISIGGELLVSANGQTRNEFTQTASDPPAFQLDGAAVVVTGGLIGAWTSLADDVDDFISTFNNITTTLATEVNALHTAAGAAYDLNGNPGTSFFSIDVDNNLIVDITDPRLVAAASTLNTGDGSNALAIAQMAFISYAGIDNTSFDKYVNSMLVSLGVSIQEEQARATDSNYVVNMISDELQRLTGVSIDEEMVDLISAQRAFAAAAKIIATIDDMFETILYRM